MRVGKAAPTFFLALGRGALPVLVPPRGVLVVDVHRDARVQLRAALRAAAVSARDGARMNVKCDKKKICHDSHDAS